ncbi:MAG: adenylosuccinate lyase, partial [Ignavibacteriaceae bacterium]|nr:adenylosuccinate lyase [Ignavibacteriaceae bacterium]
GATREEAYSIVQESAMKVWADKEKNLRDELLSSASAGRYLSASEIEALFDGGKLVKSVDAIFKRTVEK